MTGPKKEEVPKHGPPLFLLTYHVFCYGVLVLPVEQSPSLHNPRSHFRSFMIQPYASKAAHYPLEIHRKGFRMEDDATPTVD